MKKTLKNKVFASLLMVTILTTVLAPISYRTQTVQKAEAIPVNIWLDTSPTGVANSAANAAVAAKEAADSLYYMAAKVFMRAMVNSIITWINSGFQGSPSFVTDLDGFLLGVADATIGEFIYDDPALNFLCSPFELDVKAAIAIQYYTNRAGNYQPQCTLSGVVGNVENFLAGDFEEGGWTGMIELVQTPTNNPTGAFLSGQGEAYARIIDNQGREITKLDFGDGFFSLEICDVADQASGAAPNCVIGTPGSVIANQLNKALGAGVDELISADEVNEIFVALFNQLALQVMNGAFGLLGLGGNDSYTDDSYGFGDGSYLEAIQEEEANLTLDTGIFDETAPISQGLVSENNYLDLQDEAIGRIEAARAAYDEAAQELADQGIDIGFDFPVGLTTALAEATLKQEAAATAIAVLEQMRDIYNNGTVDEQGQALDEYNNLITADLLHDGTDVTIEALYIQNDIIPQIEDLMDDIQDALDAA